GYFAKTTDCPAGVCPFRATHVWMTREGTTWNVPSAWAGTEWIAVQNPNLQACKSGCIIQEGFGKWDTAGEPAGCASGTASGVKQWYGGVDSFGAGLCIIGQDVTSNEGHSEKVQHCPGTSGDSWC